MVATGVYEAGFECLRRHLREGGDLRTPGSAPMPTALPVPARRVALRRYGGPEELEAENADAPPPREGEVRIRQRAIGVNFIDVYLRRGWIPPMLPVSNDAPGVLGMEAAGSVLDVGARRQPRDARRPRGLPRPRCPAPIAACAACRPAGCCACPPRWKTTPPPRCC